MNDRRTEDRRLFGGYDERVDERRANFGATGGGRRMTVPGSDRRVGTWMFGDPARRHTPDRRGG